MTHEPLRQLARLFNTRSFDFESCAHLCIDVQERFCCTNLTWRTARHIAKNLVPIFEELAIPTYYIWFARAEEQVPDFYLPEPESHMVIRKTEHSAFKGTSLDDTLKQRGINNLLITGFSFGVCIRKTVLDARAEKYSVTVIQDGTNYSDMDYTSDEIRKARARLAYSDEVLPLLQQAKTATLTRA